MPRGDRAEAAEVDLIPSPRARASLRAFNRFELKYLVDQRVASALRTELAGRLDYDPNSRAGSYTVWSRYYDTRDLRFYWEKIEGIRFRRKLRVRHYGRPSDLTPETPVWVEVKQRVNRVTQKRRALLPYGEASRLCAGQEPGGADVRDGAVIEEVLATFVIGGAVLIMQRFDWYKLDVGNQIVKVQMPGEGDYTTHFDDVFARLTTQSELVSLESIRGGALTELMYTVKLRKGTSPGELVGELQKKSNGQKVTVLTGYDRTDL